MPSHPPLFNDLEVWYRTSTISTTTAILTTTADRITKNAAIMNPTAATSTIKLVIEESIDPLQTETSSDPATAIVAVSTIATISSFILILVVLVLIMIFVSEKRGKKEQHQQEGEFPPQQGGWLQQGGWPQQGECPQHGGWPQQGRWPQHGECPQHGGWPQQGRWPNGENSQQCELQQAELPHQDEEVLRRTHSLSYIKNEPTYKNELTSDDVQNNDEVLRRTTTFFFKK